MERLAERLVDLIDASVSHPFESPFVVVQGRGMERWLAQVGAERGGIFAGVRVARVRDLVKLVCDAALPAASTPPLDPATYVFRILGALDAVLATPDGAPFQRYLAARDDPERRAQLAERLADAFDRYSVHRPALLDEWRRGVVQDDELARAEAALFRCVIADAPEYEGKRIADAIGRLDAAHPLLARALPRSVYFFGVATLAPLYLALLHRLADVIEVHLFVLAPGTEWLSDLSRDETASGEIGSLIRGFGKLAADFQSLLEEHGEADADYVDGDDPLPTTVLRVLQHDLRTLTQRGSPDEGREAPVEVANDDRSFVVHACHSERRELEALRELVLDLLESDPTLEPGDIAVLSADIERYAPLIRSVFAREVGAPSRVPFHVADESARATSPLVDAFIAAFAAMDERATLPRIVDLLARPPVAARIGLDADTVEVAAGWLHAAGARWGLDAEDRTREGQPPFAEHTFERSLDRLALGYALGTDARTLNGIVPSVMPMEKDATTLGALLEFFDTFRTLRAESRDAADVAWHAAFALKVVSSLFESSGGFEDDAVMIESAIAATASQAKAASFDGLLSREAFLRMVTAELDSASGTAGFLRGGITFCRQVPMRAIPFRVICLLGLDAESYPRNVEPPRFDLVARAPERGDRSPRDDDRQAFLDALLSARDALHIFHVGRDVSDDRERPVSSLVSRTLDVIDRAVRVQGGRPVRDLTFVAHPLHSFDPAHFAEDARARGLISRDELAYRCAEASVSPSEPLLADVSVESDVSPNEVRFEDLLAFLKDSERDFVGRVLGADARSDATSLPAREALEAKGLEGHAIRSEAITAVIRGTDDDQARVALRGRGLLAPGVPGELDADGAISFARAAVELAEFGTPMPPARFVLDLGRAKLAGTLESLYSNGAITVVASKLSHERGFLAFVRHLALVAAAPEGVEPRTRLVVCATGPGPAVPTTFDVPALGAIDPLAMLDVLVDAYVESRRAPSVMDADVFETYANARTGKSPVDEGAALERALVTFLGSFEATFDGRPARASAARRLLFGDLVAGSDGLDPSILGPQFLRVAEQVYMPFAACEGGVE